MNDVIPQEDMADIENAEEYVSSAFALLGRDLPVKNGRVDLKLALSMCVHLAAVGEISTLPDWLALRDPFGWPEGTAYPTDNPIDG